MGATSQVGGAALSILHEELNTMVETQSKARIAWYRSPLDRATMEALNARSDWQGFLQTGGYLGLLALTGAAAWYASRHLPWPLLLVALFVHGTFFAFLVNAFHEFCHRTVFRTKLLNTVFLYIVSFLGWHNPVLFWTSHQEHHKYTLHPPADLEVVLPVKLTFGDFAKNAIVNPWGFYGRLKGVVRLSLGRLEGEWENHLFPASAVGLRRRLFTWARILLIGHVLIVAVSFYFHLWLLPVLITFAPFYGGWLQYLCNNCQHVGLQDNVADYRLCCWTVIMNPFLSFVYWRMNYHTEHHMYAAVPCYNLAKLHAQIETDLQPCPRGLLAVWQQIVAILRQQQTDSGYQYVPSLPAPIVR
jgi:fatty acid desaturase